VIGAFANWLLARGVAQRWARPLAWALLILAIVGIGRLGWRIWLSGHDTAVVAVDRDESNVKVLNTTIGAERSAGANMAARDAAEANQVQAQEEKINAAHRRRTSALDALSGDGVQP
jgi:hypothetical protein